MVHFPRYLACYILQVPEKQRLDKSFGWFFVAARLSYQRWRKNRTPPEEALQPWSWPLGAGGGLV
jgi:hypothetical protein